MLGEGIAHQQFVLAVDEPLAGEVGQIETRREHDGIGGARFLAPAAEDAAQHVDLVAIAEALARRGGMRWIILRPDHGDRVGRTGDRAQLAADAALQAVIVLAQLVNAAESLGVRERLARIIDRRFLAEEVLERGAHARDETADGAEQPDHPRLPIAATMPATISRLTTAVGNSTFQPNDIKRS